MRIATWNVNSLRARAPQLLDWLVDRRIDVALLQETKCGDVHVPFNDIEALGYEVAHHGVDQWNGVAILSRVGLADVQRGFARSVPEPFDEPRVVSAQCGQAGGGEGVRCWSVYVPNGRSLDDPHFAYKLRWLDELREELLAAKAASGRSLVAGDFNVGPADIDFYDPKRWRNRKHATPEERSAVQGIVDLGLTDLARDHHPDEPMFTWWNYVRSQFMRDRGLRIDLALASASVAGSVGNIWVDRAARDPEMVAPAKPSDHAPVIIDLADS